MNSSILDKNLQYVRGLPFPKNLWSVKETVEEALDYVPHDGDIIILSYPKTGSTWLQYIVHQIVTKAQTLPKLTTMCLEIIPFIEATGAKAVDALKHLRIYKHHLPYNMVKKNDKAKYLYIYRNPEDCLVSYFHFIQSFLDEPLNFDAFFEEFLVGKTPYGSYFEHILSYLSYQNPENILFISYEQLKAKRKPEILRVAKFLGDSYFQELSQDESVLDRIIELTSFDHMKASITMHHPSNLKNGERKRGSVNFFRKGVVGDGKNYLSVDQQKMLRDHVAKMMKGTHIGDEWLN